MGTNKSNKTNNKTKSKIKSKSLTKPPKKRGRKSAWDTKIEPRLEQIAHWCRKGYTEDLICEALGISNACFFKYKAEKKELVNAIRVNKEIADLTVENSLYKRANGYEYEETTIEYEFDKDGNKKEVKSKTVKKQKSPNVTAQIYWLNNRTREWADRHVVAHEGEINQTGTIEHEHSHTIELDKSADNIAGVLSLLLETGFIKTKLVEHCESEPGIIDVTDSEAH